MKNNNIPTSSNGDWVFKAACKNEDPDVFFPLSQSNVDAVAVAKKICERCVVKEECLDWAADTNQAYGIWGGMTQDELEAYRNRRAKIR